MGWTIFFLFVVLKIPVLAAFLIVWWAARAEPEPPPETDEGGGGGGGVRHARTPRPRPPRRGPHCGPAPSAPRRSRTPVRRRNPARH
jgi:hypothetical protein